MGWRAERLHYERVNGYVAAVERLFDAAVTRLMVRINVLGFPAAEGFKLADEPRLAREVKAAERALREAWRAQLETAVAREWDAAEADADALASAYCRWRGKPPTEAELRRWYGRAEAARRAFEGRRAGGLSLSERVWRAAEGFPYEIEEAINAALAEGVPAGDLARAVKQYLKEPNRRFRRVRGKDGKLHLSRPARAYHPGAGVYRSSYMNARRLAATETNMAYRAADHARWQRMDFVVGIEIRLSQNHNCKGIPAGAFHDICDELAGRYPKDFKFVGWHPHCRCFAVPILQTPDAVADGGALEGMARVGGVSVVKELPREFNEWARANAERIAASAARGRLPYFITDNFNVTAAGLARRRGAGLVVAFPGAVAAARGEYQQLRGCGWAGVFFDGERGGFVAVHPARLARGKMSKQEGAKLDKELRMCRAFAGAGHRVKMLEEIPRVPSPDVTLDGVPAELKSVGSANNIVKYARRAVRVQGAKMVLFEIETRTGVVEQELDKLRRGGINGFYYYRDERVIRKL